MNSEVVTRYSETVLKYTLNVTSIYVIYKRTMILVSSSITRGQTFIAFFFLIVSTQIRAANLRYLANRLDKVLANSMKAENIETTLRYVGFSAVYSFQSNITLFERIVYHSIRKAYFR